MPAPNTILVCERADLRVCAIRAEGYACVCVMRACQKSIFQKANETHQHNDTHTFTVDREPFLCVILHSFNLCVWQSARV